MKILKFGGTSVGSASRMKAVVDLIANDEPKIVVLSAMSGTTNRLLQIADYLRLGNAGGRYQAKWQRSHGHTVRPMMEEP